MRLRVFLGLLAMAVFGPNGTATATAPEPPPVTVNEFLPEERGLGECISAIPKPGCGSEARGGWRQTMVFLTILAGLGVIAWRIVAGARRARPTPSAAP